MKTYSCSVLILAALASLTLLAITLYIQPAYATSQVEINKKIDAATNSYEAHRYAEASKRFIEVVKFDPKHVLAWYFLGRSLSETGDTKSARLAFEKILEIQPSGKLAESAKKQIAKLTELKTINANDATNAQSKTPVYILQAGAFANAEDAEKVKEKLVRLGMPAFVQDVNVPDKGVWHRVRLGPYNRSNQVKKALAELKQSAMNATPVQSP